MTINTGAGKSSPLLFQRFAPRDPITGNSGDVMLNPFIVSPRDIMKAPVIGSPAVCFGGFQLLPVFYSVSAWGPVLLDDPFTFIESLIGVSIMLAICYGVALIISP